MEKRQILSVYRVTQISWLITQSKYDTKYTPPHTPYSSQQTQSCNESALLPCSKIMPCTVQLACHDQSTTCPSQTHPDLSKQYCCWMVTKVPLIKPALFITKGGLPSYLLCHSLKAINKQSANCLIFMYCRNYSTFCNSEGALSLGSSQPDINLKYSI